MVSARSRTRSRVRCRTFRQQKRDRRASPSRFLSQDCSRSRSRSPSPSPSRSRYTARSVSSSPDDDDALRSRVDRADKPRFWKQRGRSPITLRELSSLTDDEDATASKVLVAGLNKIVTEKDLKKKFASFARVLDVCILKACNESRGMALLTLDPEGNVDGAIKALDQTEWNGCIVLVEKLH